MDLIELLPKLTELRVFDNTEEGDSQNEAPSAHESRENRELGTLFLSCRNGPADLSSGDQGFRGDLTIQCKKWVARKTRAQIVADAIQNSQGSTSDNFEDFNKQVSP